MGYPTPIRKSILDILMIKGVKVRIVEQEWDDQEKANLMTKTKILLNIHNFGNNNFEPLRIIPAIAAGAFVITETSVNDSDYNYLNDALIRVPYNKLVETVIYYLKNDDERIKIQQNASNILKQTKFKLPLC
jgi:hypothetical protein